MRPTSRACLYIAFLVVFYRAVFAHAQDTSEAPGSTGSTEQYPFHLTLPSDHLLGDWLGARSWMVDHGITPTVTFDTDALGNPTGGIQHGFTTANNLGIDLHFDLEKLRGPKGGTFQISASERFGTSLSQQDIGNVFTVQQLFGGETFHLVNVAYQQELLDERLEVLLGRIAAGDDFLTSPYNCAFVQNGFCGNPVGIFFNSPGMTAYPNATWGIRVKVRPTQRTYVMGGAYNGDPAIRADKYHGANWSMQGPVFAIGEVAYQANGLPGDQGLIGNYKAGFWYDNSQYTDFNTVGPGQSPSQTRGNWGFYAMFDQVLVAFGDRGSNRGFGITGSFLVSPKQSISQMPYFFNAGVVARGIFASRPTDVGAIGVVYGYFSNDLQDSQQRQQLLNPPVGVQLYEMALEFTYKFYFFKNAVYFQPDLQYIIRPGGTGQISNALVLGFQAGVNF
jgi:porin